MTTKLRKQTQHITAIIFYLNQRSAQETGSQPPLAKLDKTIVACIVAEAL